MTVRIFDLVFQKPAFVVECLSAPLFEAVLCTVNPQGKVRPAVNRVSLFNQILVQKVSRLGPPGSVWRVEKGLSDRSQCRDHLRADEDQIFFVRRLPVACAIYGIRKTVQNLEFGHLADCPDINSAENLERIVRRLRPVSTGCACAGAACVTDVRTEATATW